MLSSILVPSALMDPDHPLSTELWKWAASIRHLMWKSSAPLSCKFGQNSITSRDVKSTCFKGSRMSCDVANFGVFFAVILARKGHITWWMLLAEKKKHCLENTVCYSLTTGPRPPPQITLGGEYSRLHFFCLSCPLSGQDFYQTHARTRVESGFFPDLFCSKHRK